jgi:sulfhydrogenase subunit beta (sulfur reductase)
MNIQHAVITHENLLKTLGEILSSGQQLFAPHRNGLKTYYKQVSDVQEIVFDYIQTTESPKALLFPKVERMLSYELHEKQIQVTDHAKSNKIPERVLFGSRPCDAVALKTLADFFRSDISDVLVQQRQDALTIISMACIKSDENCFCTSVGISPGDTVGSDLLLIPLEQKKYYAEAMTEKGNAILSKYEQYFEKSELIKKEQYLAKIEKTFSGEEITKRLSKAFDHEVWKDASLRCIGCGICAFVCPICSCFDIQDEGTERKGDRVRCWDSCGFSLFTLHTSGHNPRHIQSERWRQRLMHKFSYMPEQFELLGCVGCGRCSRACPVDMNMIEQLGEIVKQVTTV